MKSVYFDNAASTPLLPEVITAMTTVLATDYGNPSATHSIGRRAKQLVESTRKNIAALVAAEAAEIIFTSGATEANTMILQSAVQDLKITDVISSKIEHHAVLDTLVHLAKKYTVTIHYVQIQEDGRIDYAHLETLLHSIKGKTLVSLMHVNNEIGTVLDIERVGQLCEHYHALFHCDMVQSIGHLPLSFAQLSVDFAVASAHKFHGPKGTGFAYIKKNSGIRALQHGGSQERGYRGGTEGVHNIIGMGVALSEAYQNLDQDTEHLKALYTYCKSELEMHIPGVTFNGTCHYDEKQPYTILNVSFPFSIETPGMLVFHLDLKGIACSKGSACQSGSQKDSHVLAEFLTAEQLSRPYLRFSFSKFNTLEEIDYLITILQQFLA